MLIHSLLVSDGFSVQEAQKLKVTTGLPFVRYTEIEDTDISLQLNPFLVIQWEALHRLWRHWDVRGKKLVLLCDEWNSIMRQMESSAGRPGEDMMVFQVCPSTHLIGDVNSAYLSSYRPAKIEERDSNLR